MKIRVLLVDDEKEFVESLSERLELRLFEVKTCFRGDDAVLLLQQEDLDVVILDVLMPGKDGIEVLKELKQRYPKIKVIMVTAVKDIKFAVQAIKMGAYEYITKPFEKEKVIETVKKLLS